MVDHKRMFHAHLCSIETIIEVGPQDLDSHLPLRPINVPIPSLIDSSVYTPSSGIPQRVILHPSSEIQMPEVSKDVGEGPPR